MKPGILIGPRFRVVSRIPSASTTSYLVRETGMRGRASWVLRLLPSRSPGSMGDLYRPDILDLASFRHASLALPVSFGKDPTTGKAYFVRPHVDGCDILHALRGQAPKDLFPYLIACAEALGLLHRGRLIHGNLKASNLILPKGAREGIPRDPRRRAPPRTDPRRPPGRGLRRSGRRSGGRLFPALALA